MDPQHDLDARGDFVFRWRVDPAEPDPSDPTVDLVGSVLRELLRTVVLTHEGSDVRVDGFRFVGEEEVHGL